MKRRESRRSVGLQQTNIIVSTSCRYLGKPNKWLLTLSAAALVFSSSVYAETAITPTNSGSSGGSVGLSPAVNVNGNAYSNNTPPPPSPNNIAMLGAVNVIGQIPQPLNLPLQVTKTPKTVTTLTPITVTANVDKSGCTGGDPVNLASGTKLESVTDFAMPGEMGLSFTRYYSSNFRNEGTYAGTRDGAWTTSYDYSLFIDTTQQQSCPDYTSSSSLCALVLIRPDGSAVQFATGTANGDGTASFRQLYNGVATMTRNSDGSYVIHDEDSKILTFSHTLYNSTYFTLTSIKDLAGVGWTFTYPDASDAVVTHTSGQQVLLHWTTSEVSAGIAGYDVNRQLTVTDPAGNTYIYNTSLPAGTMGNIAGSRYLWGELQSVVLPGAPSTTVSYKYISDKGGLYGFGNYQYALTEVDYNGVAHDLTSYDTLGRATQTEMADGTQKVSIAYSSNSTGNIATLTNELGHVSVYQFDASLNILSVTGQASAKCAATFNSQTYDANENVASQTDNNGHVTNYTYAANGEILQKVENPGPYARTTTYTWDPTPGTDRLSSVTIAGYLQTNFTYNAQGRLASVVQTNLTSNGAAGQSRTTTYSYSLYSNGMVQSSTGVIPSPGNATTMTYNYDTLGHLTSISNALGQTTTYSNFAGLGSPQTVTSPNGDVTNYTYNAGRLTSFAHTHAGVMNIGYVYYDANSRQVSEIVAPDNEITQYSYDADFKLVSSTWTGPSGAVIIKKYAYDAKGDVTSTSWTRQGASAPDLVTNTSYDELGRPIVVNGNHGQFKRIAYDPNGNISTVTDTAGNVTTYQYDSTNRLQYLIDPAGESTLYLYDFGNKPLQVTDPRGLTTYYKYDGLGNLWALTSPDTGTTSFSYDAYGRLTTKTTNDGAVTTYGYDTLNRVTNVIAGGLPRTYVYDSCTYGKGRLCSFGDETGGTSYTYNIEGTVASKNVMDYRGTSTISRYVYDGINRLIQISDGGTFVTNFVTNYTWTDDQVSSINLQFNGQSVNVVSNATYDALRHPLGWTYGNGMQRAQTYDNDGRLTAINSTFRSVNAQSLQYFFDSVNRISTINNLMYPSLTQTFGYDNLDRLTVLTNQGASQSMTIGYDANGNRTRQYGSIGMEEVTVASTSNQILARGGHTYTYTANGNRATDTVNGVTTTYSYDAFNSLSNVSRSTAVRYCETNGECPIYPAGTTSYTTNALGQRMVQNGPAGFKMYWYGLNGELTSEVTTPPGGAQNYNYYVYFNGQPVALVNNYTALYYIHGDHLGRPETITDSSANGQWWAFNYAFDRFIRIGDVIGNVDIGLPGQVYDSFTGNWSNGFRDYDASNGRYLEADPIGLGGGINTYAYVGGNPLSYVDPFGMSREDVELITALVRTNEPELQVPSGPIVYFKDVNLSGNQYTTVHQEGTYEEKGDSMSLSDKYLGQLGEKDLLDLYDTIAHESLHKTCGPDSAKPAEHYYISQEAHRMTTVAAPLIQDYFGYGH